MASTSPRAPQAPAPAPGPVHQSSTTDVRARKPRWTTWLVVLTVLVAVVAMTACGDDDDDDTSTAGSAPAPTSADLDGKTFVATELDGQDIVEGTEVSLTFQGDQV